MAAGIDESEMAAEPKRGGGLFGGLRRRT
jgi:hypothetical protein